MTSPLATFAPSCVVLAVAGYCVWPYIADSTPTTVTEQTANLPQVPLSQLSPTLSPAPLRDPFAPSAAPSDRTSRTPEKVGALSSGQPAKPEPSQAASKGAPPAKQPASAPPSRGAPEATRGAADALADAGKLTLRATSVYGNQRLTLINDRIYREGDALPRASPTDPECVVARVLSDRVVLASAGKTIELKYSDWPVGPTAQTKTAGAAAGRKPGTSTASSTAAPSRNTSPPAEKK